MGIFDSVTNLFSSTPDPNAPPADTSSDGSTPTADTSNPDAPMSVGTATPPQVPAYDPAMMLSSQYSLADLTATQQQLTAPNMPSTDAQIANLQILADVLEKIGAGIGTFTLLSGFRTLELQNVLAAAGEPTATGTSFHELGRAEDIAPTTMGLTEMFGRLLAPQFAPLFAEIAIKPGQGAIHLSVNTPDDTRAPKVLGLNSSNVYTRLTPDEIAGYVKPYLPATEDVTAYVDASLDPSTVSPTILIAGLAIAAAAFFMMNKKKRGA